MNQVRLSIRVSKRTAAAAYEAGKKLSGKTNGNEIINAQKGSYIARLFSGLFRVPVQCDARAIRNYGLLPSNSLDVKL